MRKPSAQVRRASFLALLFVPLLAPAQDVERGRLLYEAHCGGCHDERVHQRLRSEIRGLADLRDAVARWAPHSKRSYALDELEDLTAYINERHYRIGLPPHDPARRREAR